jgi:hypothetical protein
MNLKNIREVALVSYHWNDILNFTKEAREAIKSPIDPESALSRSQYKVANQIFYKHIKVPKGSSEFDLVRTAAFTQLKFPRGWNQ